MSVLTWPDEGISVLGMSTTAATQESKVTQNIVIDASQVQEGDKIRVTTQDGDRTNTFTGVANHYKADRFEGNRRWFTADDWTLWTGEDSAVIELLDRPLPKVPSLPHAVVKYTGHNGLGGALKRTAVRGDMGVWKSYDDYGFCTLTRDSDKAFAELIASKTDVTVVFGGVAK